MGRQDGEDNERSAAEMFGVAERKIEQLAKHAVKIGQTADRATTS